MKKRKVTYNQNGLKRVDNVAPKTSIPKKDLNLKNIIIHKNKGNYWRVEKKK